MKHISQGKIDPDILSSVVSIDRSYDSVEMITAQFMMNRLVQNKLGDFLLDELKESEIDVGILTLEYVLEKINNSAVRDKMQSAVNSILDYLHLPHNVFFTFSYQEEKEGGNYVRKGERREINLFIQSWYTSQQILAVLCHECTHYFMEANGLNSLETDFNEKRTDIMASLIGFGNILAAGYAPVKSSHAEGQQIVKVTRRLGYVPSEEISEIVKYKTTVQKEYEEKLKDKKRFEELKSRLQSAVSAAKMLNEQIMNLPQASGATSDFERLQNMYVEYEQSNAHATISADEKLIPGKTAEMVEKALHREECLIMAMMRWYRIAQSGEDILSEIERKIDQVEKKEELDEILKNLRQYRMFCVKSTEQIEKIEHELSRKRREFRFPWSLFKRLKRAFGIR